MILIGLTPNRFGLRLDTADGAKESHGSVQNSQRTFDFDRKIHMTGSVDYIDLMIIPVTGGGGGSNSYASFLFLVHPIHGGGSVVHLSNPMGFASIIKDTLSRSSLTGVNMSHDADIPDEI
jgi:hypothetical protein